ncbi:MAG: class B sortase [Clostridia bacterium]|nr:class B sortase [Clostridia bacterium]
MKKTIRIVIIVLSSAVLLYYAFKLVRYLAFSEMNRQENSELVSEVVSIHSDFMEWFEEETDVEPAETQPSEPVSDEPPPDTIPPESRDPESEPSELESSSETSTDAGPVSPENPSDTPKRNTPISVNFDVLKQLNENAIGWLYQAGTPINYPVLQGKDNAYYLDHSFDGKYNVYGCLFLDFRNSAGFSDNASIIYGHEAKNGSMFGSLSGYKTQEYYDAHKTMYLFTPEGNYRIRIFAGCIVQTNSRFFTVPVPEEERAEWVREAIENSTFQSGLTEEEISSIVVFSTCTYEFENARLLVFGSLEELARE